MGYSKEQREAKKLLEQKQPEPIIENQNPTIKMEQSKSPKPKIGNAELADQLAKIDYDKLSGESWQYYLALTRGELKNPKLPVESHKNPRSGGLPGEQLYDFEGYRCMCIKEELYPGMKDTPTYVNGIVLKDKTPEMNTRITISRANTLNDQVANMTLREPGIYYLIKKVSPTK